MKKINKSKEIKIAEALNLINDISHHITDIRQKINGIVYRLPDDRLDGRKVPVMDELIEEYEQFSECLNTIKKDIIVSNISSIVDSYNCTVFELMKRIEEYRIKIPIYDNIIRQMENPNAQYQVVAYEEEATKLKINYLKNIDDYRKEKNRIRKELRKMEAALAHENWTNTITVPDLDFEI